MILLDTNVLSETLKPQPHVLAIEWLTEHDAEILLPVIALAEIACGIERIRPDQRTLRLTRGLEAWRGRSVLNTKRPAQSGRPRSRERSKD
ncbi:MAG: PIN domain-containing protein [Wenzhouxiangella sp.]|nr:PIN domain-containing protein [Wenzhouxiangella sp.]